MKLPNSFTTLKVLALATAMSATALVDAQDGTRATKADKATDASTSKAVQTDGQILQVVRSLNNAEIDQAKHVMDESENAEVKVIAQSIINDHDQSNDQIDGLLDGALDLDDSPLNETLQDQTEETQDMLAKLEGAQLDCQYLQKQVAQHQLALDTIKNDLMPDAQSAGVKAFLTESAPKLESHMQEAQEAIRSLSGCSSAALSRN
jgi:predicted outer membrane protein